MKIRFLHSMAGADESFTAGHTYELDDARAERLIEGGAAVSIEPVDESDDEPQFSDPAEEGIETATRRQPETTARRRKG